jgi:hypothetical protein
MKKAAMLAASVILTLVALASGANSAGPATILKADTLAGVSGPYVGTVNPATNNPIRGINGGGVPWSIAEGKVVLGADGSLVAKVEGLVLAGGPLTGTNPITQFKAIVSCLTMDGTSATTTNVSTGLFPATTAGNSKIEATLALPSPCFAPIVFVTSPGGSWFAVTGV